MGDVAEERESGAGEPKPRKKKAEDNPWYLLATLYGVPDLWYSKLLAKNRIAWNRYFAADFDDETRARLIEQRRHPAEELTPFSPDELQEVTSAFAERCNASAKELALPASGATIDFQYIEFKQDAFFNGYVFRRVSFDGAAFCGGAEFDGAVFSRLASFGGAAFSRWAKFDGAAFFGGAEFNSAAFSGRAAFNGAAFPAQALFDGAAFLGLASFESAAFFGWVSFDGAAFSGGAKFDGADFSGTASFVRAVFSKLASFVRAAFSAWTKFEGAAFSGGASFDGAAFSRSASFVRAAFSDRASFNGANFAETSSFVNGEMKGETSFEGAKFLTKPPSFSVPSFIKAQFGPAARLGQSPKAKMRPETLSALTSVSSSRWTD